MKFKAYSILLVLVLVNQLSGQTLKQKKQWWEKLVIHSEKVQKVVLNVKDDKSQKNAINSLKTLLIAARQLQKEKETLNFTEEERLHFYQVYENRFKAMMENINTIHDNLKNYPEVLKIYREINGVIK